LLRDGIEAQQSGRAVEAMDAYRQAGATDPSLFEAHYNLGVIAAEQGRTADALAAYEQALAVDGTSIRARYNFAVALESAGYLHDAAREFERTAADHPDEARVHFSLARLYADKLRDPARARPHFERVLQIEPQHPQATAIRYWIEGQGGRGAVPR
jgi:tetratricopeptide (TPR) repeat protein